MDSNEIEEDLYFNKKGYNLDNYKQFFKKDIILPRRNNEQETHWICKNLIFHYLTDVGCSNLTEECIFDGKRFDLYGKNPDGTNFGVEVGEFNCPSRLLRKRLKESYEYVDYIFWMPRNYIDFEHYIDFIRDCSEGISIYECMTCLIIFKGNISLFGIDLKELFKDKQSASNIPDSTKEQLKESCSLS